MHILRQILKTIIGEWNQAMSPSNLSPNHDEQASIILDYFQEDLIIRVATDGIPLYFSSL